MSITPIEIDFTIPPDAPTRSNPDNYITRAETFYAWLVVFGSTLKSFVSSLNVFTSQANNLKDEMNTIQTRTEQSEQLLQNAIGKANEIQGYVIPDGVAYNKDEVDDMYVGIYDELFKIKTKEVGLKI